MAEMSKSEFIHKKSEELFELLNTYFEGGPTPYGYCRAKHSLPDEMRVRLNLFLSNLVLDVGLSFPAPVTLEQQLEQIRKADGQSHPSEDDSDTVG